MVDRTGSRTRAGGGNKLNIIRYGRDEMTQYEHVAGDDIFPGQALEMGTGEDGETVFEHHSGDETKSVYVAVEARGRGMDAQTDTGYVEGENYVIAVNASGGGLNLRVAEGENLEAGDAIVPEEETGNFVEVSDEEWAFAEAGESYETDDGDALVASEVSGQ